MRISRAGTPVVIVMLALCATPATLAQGIRVDVVGGKHEVTDWVAEATLDLAAAAKLLGAKGRPDRVAVFELEASGAPGERVAGQVDRAVDDGLYAVSWRVPGKLGAGTSRKFVVSFGLPGEVIEEKHPIRLEGDQNTATITNSNAVTGDSIVLMHERAEGGMIRSVTIGETQAALGWNDRLYDGKMYYVSKHSARKMDVTAQGPLRATIETEGEYLLLKTVQTLSGPMGVEGDDPEAGKRAASRPRAAYRFTNYAGLPFTIVEALVEQDFAHQWRSMMFMEVHFRSDVFTHYWTDTVNLGEQAASGRLKQNGKEYTGREWAAVYNDTLLMATCAGVGPVVYDGGGGYYVSYLKSGRVSMTGLRYPWKAALIWGAGPRAIEDKTVQRWSEILADPPKVRVSFEALEERLAAVEQAFEEKEKVLAGLSGDAWISDHVSVTVGRVQAAIARQKFLSGRFGEALDALKVCEEFLVAKAGEVKLITKGTIHAGTVQGYPYLGNAGTVFLWAKPQDGAGLISIFDRRSNRELLKVDAKRAPLWRIGVKKKRGGAGYENTGNPCEVKAEADEEEGRLRFQWSKGIVVEVEARLEAGESLLRSRLTTKTNGDSGLVTVTFPVIEDVMPFSPRAEKDKVLETWGLGWVIPSPLVSGKVSYGRNPSGMPFAAVYGDGLGIYIAEEDGETNRKEWTWTPDKDSQTLDFSIAHPVLNWGAESFVEEYKSPGDIVIGPFHGDWYDAARLYRKWALTAPWCAKGPIYERSDYPKWLLRVPYWSWADIGDEASIQRIEAVHEFYGLPVTAAHAYDCYFMPIVAGKFPKYFPPKLGSEGFTNAVDNLQKQGIRIICFISGYCWDLNTESFRTKDARNKAAILNSVGEITFFSSGIKQSLVHMCPASKLWRQTMLDVSKELVGRYGVDGIYYDYLTFNTSDCYNKGHDHAICGGDFWAESVHEFYELMRTECKKLNPDILLTGEGIGEFCIDVLDIFLCGGQSKGTPLFPAVYHGYTNYFGGEINKVRSPPTVGRGWLWGRQNGWNNMEYQLTGRPMGEYYRKLLQCRWEFGTPYLGYGEMLRPPRVEGDLPSLTAEGGQGPFTVPAVEGSAWKAPDGTIGVFFLNYDERPHEFTWSMDLAETGINHSRKLALSNWTQKEGLMPVKETNGGVVRETMSIEPWGIIALKMEVKP